MLILVDNNQETVQSEGMNKTVMTGLWYEGFPVASTAPDTAECARCGEDVAASDVCCADYIQAPDGLMEYDGAVCVRCCGPHPKRMSGVGEYERMDCDH